ncbi:MAG: hypothetical protein QG652_1425 [Pseudomonadota bacterium]|nr:hypothetical protein [Pseudomonadota bacterium]
MSSHPAGSLRSFKFARAKQPAWAITTHTSFSWLSIMTKDPASSILVRHFRQRLLWPLQLTSLDAMANKQHWQLLEQDKNKKWQRINNAFSVSAGEFSENIYKEFVVFLPYVQRFIYGESRGRHTHGLDDPPGDSALKIFRRHDVKKIRVVLRAGDAPILLTVDHIELCFFDDIDIVFLNIEVTADNLSLTTARDLLYRFGRAYPTGWNDAGQGVHNTLDCELLAEDGTVLAQSDSGNREKFLAFACEHRAPCTSSHWNYLLQPLVLNASDNPGDIRYDQIEYHRMPLMAYLAVDEPLNIMRQEWLRLGLVATLHPDEPLPLNDAQIIDFDNLYCYDRYWAGSEAGPNTRFLCSGRAFIVVGDAQESYFLNNERGIQAQFRHQYFIMFLISHFHRAALLIFSDRLVDAIHDLDMRNPKSVRKFRQRIHANFEEFLRFTHRYWFDELSERPHMQALHHMCAKHLGNVALYAEVKDELHDMSQYLDSDAQRRQSTTVVRLTVVTTFSLIGTVATGFLGMNIISEADAPVWLRWSYFALTVIGASVLTFVTVMKSKQLYDFLDVLSEGRSFKNRVAMLWPARKNRRT